MTIYVGDGNGGKNECLPIVAWNDRPYVFPIVVGTGLDRNPIFPPYGDVICTYGWNLFTGDYKGKVEDWNGIPFDNGSVMSGTVTTGTASSDGLSVCKQGNLYYFYPSFPSPVSSRQKLRGSLYETYDNYISVPNCSMNESAWPTGSSVAPRVHYCYMIDNSSGNSTIKIKDGWFIFSTRGVEANPVLYCDVCWTTSENDTPCYIDNGSGEMILSSSSPIQHSQKTLATTAVDVTIPDVGTYKLVHILPQTIGNGILLISPPKIRLTIEVGVVGGLDVTQFGLTFGE